jgi:hypothetical protein
LPLRAPGERIVGALVQLAYSVAIESLFVDLQEAEPLWGLGVLKEGPASWRPFNSVDLALA